MSVLHALISSFRREEKGQGLAEYALILALIAIIAIVALIFLGGQVSQHPQQRRQLDLEFPSTEAYRGPHRRVAAAALLISFRCARATSPYRSGY